jgi:uncharacterized phage-associated protein
VLTCHDVASYFLSLVEEDSGDSVSNLKLQKLMYYAQGYHLAMHNRPLFGEQIEAWQHGPVVRSLYRSLKQHGAEPIPPAEHVPDQSRFESTERSFIEEMWEMFGQFSATKLRSMTHEESPWKTTPLNEVISHQKMKDYFCTQLVEA